jgi:hypothetical protein
VNKKSVALLVIVGAACAALRIFAATGGLDRLNLSISTDLILLGVVLVLWVIALRMFGGKNQTDVEKPDYRTRMKNVIKACVGGVIGFGILALFVYCCSLFDQKP